ncbi:2,4-dienoyl-CoA reductase, partial [Pseudomonas aeruginosa]|nr:2,4-dienoyl-CoA reductase [Pseudomonas aeruginosa]
MSYDSIFRPGLFDGQTIIVTLSLIHISEPTRH